MQQNSDISQVDNNSNIQSSAGIVLYNGPGGLRTMASGFLIGADLVLTTAYCVYSLSHKKLNTEFGDIYFLPGAHGKIQKSFKVVDSRFLEEYKECDQASKRFFEFALLKLQKSVQNAQILSLGINYIYSNDDKISVIGYSVQDVSELDEYFEFLSKKESIKASNATVAQSQLRNTTWWSVTDSVLVQHKFQTKAGSGGSPIVLWRKDQLVVVAMHILKRTSTKLRIGRLITNDMAETLSKWSKEMKCRLPIFKNLNQNLQLASENYKNKYEEVLRNNEDYQRSNISLREQNNKLKSRYESLCTILGQFKGIDKLSLPELLGKISNLNELFFKHQLKQNGISNISINYDETHTSKILSSQVFDQMNDS